MGRKPYVITSCGHTLCSLCLGTVKSCPLCRKKINGSCVNYAVMDQLPSQNKETQLTSAANSNSTPNASDMILETKVHAMESMKPMDPVVVTVPSAAAAVKNYKIELTNEQIEVASFLNGKIESIINRNGSFEIGDNEETNELIPSILYNHSTGLCGRGGTGKTHLLVDIINYWANIKLKRVCYVASTHNAVDVLKDMLMLKNVPQPTNLLISTFSKLIKRNVCNNGNLELASTADYLAPKSNFELVGYFDLIIVDESSMISSRDLQDILRRIREEKVHSKMTEDAFPCFLFSGDYRQLGPIAENKLPENCWNNVISHVLFSNNLKSRELKIIMRNSINHIQNLCDSVGGELELNFKARQSNFSLNNYKIAKMTPCLDDSVTVFKNVQIAIDEYVLMMNSFNLSTVWLHVNKSTHPKTIELTREIRKKYFLKLHECTTDMKDYFVGEYFSYNNTFLTFDINLNKKLLAANPYLKIDLPKCSRSNLFDRADFLNQTYFDIVSNRNLVRLNESNIAVNEQFKIVHIEKSKIKTNTIFQCFRQFLDHIRVECDHEITLETLYLISSRKPADMCMILNRFDLIVDYGTFCTRTKTQNNISISHLNEKIWSISSCSYKDFKTKFNPIMKLFDFRQIFPISYVNSIQTMQGSSVDNVFIGEYNLKEATHLTGIGLFTHLYTALTRAKKRIFIVE